MHSPQTTKYTVYMLRKIKADIFQLQFKCETCDLCNKYTSAERKIES